MARIVVEQHFPEPFADEQYAIYARRLDPCLETYGAVWVRSYLADDHRHVVCEFEAPDAEAVRQAYRASSIPFARVWAATVVTRGGGDGH